MAKYFRLYAIGAEIRWNHGEGKRDHFQQVQMEHTRRLTLMKVKKI